MPTKAEISDQMNALMRRPPRTPCFHLVSENGRARIVASKADAPDDAKSKGERRGNQ